MYDDLVKRLRDAAKISEALAVLLPHGKGDATAKLYKEAADAVEAMCEMVATAHGELANVIQSYEESKPRWIPVTERLPEEYETLLLLPMSGDVISGYYDSEHKSYCDMTGFRRLCTHWMPLPQPPKEE